MSLIVAQPAFCASLMMDHKYRPMIESVAIRFSLMNASHVTDTANESTTVKASSTETGKVAAVETSSDTETESAKDAG